MVGVTHGTGQQWDTSSPGLSVRNFPDSQSFFETRAPKLSTTGVRRVTGQNPFSHGRKVDLCSCSECDLRVPYRPGTMKIDTGHDTGVSFTEKDGGPGDPSSGHVPSPMWEADRKERV